MQQIKKILKYVDENDLATTESDCYLNRFIHNETKYFDGEVKDMKILHSEINFRTYCDYWKCKQSRRLEERYRDLLCCHFVGKDNYILDDFLIEALKKYIDKGKIIFMVLDFVDYGLDDDVKDKNVYVPHSCVLILIPNNKEYNAYYVNSHGKDLLIYDHFEYKISSKKKRTIYYDHPVDTMFVSSLISFLNKIYNFKIHYDFSYTHNYYGADHQSGDNHGICFIFPYLLWYNFCKYYEKSRKIEGKNGEKYVIKSNKEMILEGNLTECIQSFLIYFNKNYKDVYLTSLKSKNYNRLYYIRKLDKVLEKSKNYFVLKILNNFNDIFIKC